MATKKQPKLVSAFRVYSTLAVVTAVAFLLLSGVALWAHNFVGNMVHDELAAQRIYFPPKGSAALDPKEFPDLQQYAGQLLDSPDKAKAYADGFIGRHLEKVGGGKTYAEISTLAMQNPTDQKLQQQKQTLFQGETLRGVLLTSGYGFGTIGKIAGIATWVFFLTGVGLLALAALLRTRS